LTAKFYFFAAEQQTEFAARVRSQTEFGHEGVMNVNEPSRIRSLEIAEIELD